MVQEKGSIEVHRIARAPASSANIGPGFDALAVALDLHIEVEISDDVDHLEVTSSGEGSHFPSDASHLAVRVAASVLGHDRLRIAVRSEIPVGRGLGSSAALAVASAAAAGAADPFAYGAKIDGHPENAAASALGGLVAATTIDGGAVARRLQLDPELSFVVLVPDRPLSTAEARAVLSPSIPLSSAAFNLGHLAVLIAGLADHTQLLPASCDDKLHQEQRSALFPEAPSLLEGLRDAGALSSCWSGAGPTLLAICTRSSASAVGEVGEKLLEEQSVPGRVMVLSPDHEGLVIQD